MSVESCQPVTIQRCDRTTVTVKRLSSALSCEKMVVSRQHLVNIWVQNKDTIFHFYGWGSIIAGNILRFFIVTVIDSPHTQSIGRRNAWTCKRDNHINFQLSFLLTRYVEDSKIDWWIFRYGCLLYQLRTWRHYSDLRKHPNCRHSTHFNRVSVYGDESNI